MKHLVAQEHHPHLKKRALLEAFGLVLLVILSINQRELIYAALNAIRQSDTFYLFLMFAVYWLLTPLTPISYRLLAYKKIPLTSTILAQIAGAGTGRLMPGGLGHMTIAAVHLHKLGINTQKAIIITVANNLIGVVVNLALVLAAIVYHPNVSDKIADSLSRSTEYLVFAVVLLIGSITLLQWLTHARSTRTTIRRVNSQWTHLFQHLLKSPHKLANVIIIALAITLGHVMILVLAGTSLGLHVTLTDALLSLSVGVLIAGAIPTPGGFGVVEAGVTGALIVLGYDSTQAVGVALLYRTATYWQPLVPGVFAYLYLRDRKRI